MGLPGQLQRAAAWIQQVSGEVVFTAEWDWGRLIAGSVKSDSYFADMLSNNIWDLPEEVNVFWFPLIGNERPVNVVCKDGADILAYTHAINVCANSGTVGS